MDSNQENELFKTLGSIQATQVALLEKVSEVQQDIHSSIEATNERIDKTDQKVEKNHDQVTVAIKETGEKAAVELEKYSTKNDKRVKNVEEKVNNLKLKVAGAGGAGSLVVYMIAELVKLKAGG